MSGKTILYVEDNEMNRQIVRDLLKRTTYQLIEAHDGEAGVAMALEKRPDLILMDIQLPGMDGLAATRLLKADPATAHIPVIALTAMAMKEDQEKTRAAGCDEYIAKPLRYKELLAAIDKLLAEGAVRLT